MSNRHFKVWITCSSNKNRPTLKIDILILLVLFFFFYWGEGWNQIKNFMLKEKYEKKAQFVHGWVSKKETTIILLYTNQLYFIQQRENLGQSSGITTKCSLVMAFQAWLDLLTLLAPPMKRLCSDIFLKQYSDSLTWLEIR